MQPWRTISLWMDQLEEPLCARPALRQDLDLDVCIIGAGYTGLWTAYYLKQQAPHLKIAIVEANIAGFGASGRNGGWLMGNLLGEDRLLATLSPQQRRESIDLLHGIPDEVHSVLQREGIDCDYRKGGVLYCAARYPEQEKSLRAWLDDLYRQGMTADDYRWLRPEELEGQLRLSNAYGAIFSPHTATIHPAKLVRGLARAVENLGVTIYENTPAIDWNPGQVRTPLATIRCQWAVPAVKATPPACRRWASINCRCRACWWRPSRCPNLPGNRSALPRARRSARTAARSPTVSAPSTTAWSSVPVAATASAAGCATTSA